MYELELETAVDAAQQAGDLLRTYLEVERTIQFKGATDLVTDADFASQRLIQDLLLGRFPDDGFLGEEATELGVVAGAARQWVVDPLDGTTNYAHGYPLFSVSVALVAEGRPEVGAVYVPVLGYMFAGRRGGGATLNGKPIHVSPTVALENALLTSGFAYDRQVRGDNLAAWSAFVARARGVRRSGSAAFDLCAVAAGMLDGYWERGVSAWDVAAGSVILEEAGGILTDYAGGPFDPFSREVVAGTPGIHPALLETIRESRSAASIPAG